MWYRSLCDAFLAVENFIIADKRIPLLQNTVSPQTPTVNSLLDTVKFHSLLPDPFNTFRPAGI
jgi:hypothetical protein